MPNWTNDSVKAKEQTGKPLAATPASGPRRDLFLVITGQIRGGKNNICITRTGRRFPNRQWAVWRDAAVKEIRSQLPACFVAIDQPVNVRLDYYAGDRRRRDFPAICDAVWHVLEKAGVVADDTLLWPNESSRDYAKDDPRCEIKISSQRKEKL